MRSQNETLTFLQLPDEHKIQIFSYLSFNELKNVRLVDKKLNWISLKMFENRRIVVDAFLKKELVRKIFIISLKVENRFFFKKV